MSSNITAGPVTLHLAPDEEPYDEYPSVGIVARATLTVNTGTTEQPFFHQVALESHGVWGIECPDLVAGCSIPEDNWVIGDYGNGQIKELHDLIDVLTGGNRSLPPHRIQISPSPAHIQASMRLRWST